MVDGLGVFAIFKVDFLCALEPLCKYTDLAFPVGMQKNNMELINTSTQHLWDIMLNFGHITLKIARGPSVHMEGGHPLHAGGIEVSSKKLSAKKCIQKACQMYNFKFLCWCGRG